MQLSISVNSDHQDYILDGVGASSKAPYIGIFEDAPMHLKRSFPDPINLYREPRVKDMLTEYALQLRNHFAVKTAAEIATFLLKMEQGHLMISDIPVGDWGTIFVQSSQAGTIFVSQAALVRLTLLEVLNQKLSEA